MSLPTLIELADRKVSHSTSGGVIENVWYVEPASAAPPVFEKLFGSVPSRDYKTRILPAKDFQYNYYYCDEAYQVPFDVNQFSFRSSTGYNGLPGNNDIKAALQNADLEKFSRDDVSWEITSDPEYCAGVYIKAIYRPVFTGLTNISENTDEEKLAWDYINPEFIPRHKTNVINSGLRLRSPAIEWAIPNPLNPLGNPLLAFSGLPSAGVAPTLEEQYLELVIERRMCHTSFDFVELNRYINKVNESWFSGGSAAGTNVVWKPFPRGTVRFSGYDSNIIRVPKTDGAGNPDGYNSWINLKLHFDIRMTKSYDCYSTTGVKINEETPVEWNHLFAYPGFAMELLNMLQGKEGGQLGWYKVAYSPNLQEAINPQRQPYPYTANLNSVFEGQ